MLSVAVYPNVEKGFRSGCSAEGDFIVWVIVLYLHVCIYAFKVLEAVDGLVSDILPQTSTWNKNVLR